MAQPAPQVVGSGRDPAADMQRNMAYQTAAQGAQMAGRSAKAGFIEMKAFVMKDPNSIRVIAFITGFLLVLFSILWLALPGLFRSFNAPVDDYIRNVWNIAFGLLIMIVEGKESWMDMFCNIQARVFHYAFFLATLGGRAVFYLFVGCMTLVEQPELDDVGWQIVNFCIGMTFVLIAAAQLFLYYVGPYCGCQAYKSEFDATAMHGAGPPGAAQAAQVS
mmetsp:Transcript_69677/g.167243  ORF Transcript_69677/g.167243 Transcript_69677/m.167243 type:complete len:219 (-) Transcript_69677:129-785(-)|eukprot:CAMPEP_0178388856 /NCGR_PEP_ID=MMETSP0689_2-20121128/9810_1 /TAXON_ID=160604 /ORGANISM="Amphidinium massartii, Strain CS-259" /LENGTH=218 /DNA_ID=CAMNT_0020009275 /DNA_START=18 /DNA_END=674 /DNA_ORIENTATION=+